MFAINFKINKFMACSMTIAVFLAIVFISTIIFKQKSNLDPEQYLRNLGYEIEFLYEEKITIPKKFNNVLISYNKLQKEQGFDLSKFCGKTCAKKRFLVTSSKNKSEKYVADMIVYEDKLIGGDIHKQEYKQSPMKINSIK